MEGQATILENLLIKLEEIREKRSGIMLKAQVLDLQPQKSMGIPKDADITIKAANFKIMGYLLWITIMAILGIILLIESKGKDTLPIAFAYPLVLAVIFWTIYQSLNRRIIMSKEGFYIKPLFTKWTECLGFRILSYPVGRGVEYSLVMFTKEDKLMEYKLGSLSVDEVSHYFYYYSKAPITTKNDDTAITT